MKNKDGKYKEYDIVFLLKFSMKGLATMCLIYVVTIRSFLCTYVLLVSTYSSFIQNVVHVLSLKCQNGLRLLEVMRPS